MRNHGVLREQRRVAGIRALASLLSVACFGDKLTNESQDDRDSRPDSDDPEDPPSWSAKHIDFDDLDDGEVVTDQYAGVHFATESGYAVQAVTFNEAWFGHSPPNVAATVPDSGVPTYQEELELSFDRAVRGLTIDVIGVNTVGPYARASLYAGGELLGTELASYEGAIGGT